MTETTEATRHTGEVKFFSEAKNYGFIIPDSKSEKEIFIHISSVERAGLQTLVAGERISYEVVEDYKTKKLKADNIKLIA